MLSETQSIYSEFEAANAVHLDVMNAVLDRATDDPETHARFMNTLSLLEHMGSARIMATQRPPHLDQETLKHLAEEARHAFFFKRQADRFAKRELNYAEEDMIAPAHARMYFRRLESYIAQRFKGDQSALTAVYLYMSMIIEFRAVWGYTLYQAMLEKKDVKMSLKSLLAEEQGHLTHMEERLAAIGHHSADLIRQFSAEETRLFARMIHAILADMEPQAQAA